MPRLVHPSGCYRTLHIYLGTNDTASLTLRSDSWALGVRVKESRPHVVFFSILLVEVKGPGRDAHILEMMHGCAGGVKWWTLAS